MIRKIKDVFIVLIAVLGAIFLFTLLKKNLERDEEE